MPRQAIIDKDGTSVVFVRQGSRFVSTPVKVHRRTETAAVIEGIPAGVIVALRNPEAGEAAPRQR